MSAPAPPRRWRSAYGINVDEPTPLREASRRLDMKQNEVRELEQRALDHLARAREVEALQDAA